MTAPMNPDNKTRKLAHVDLLAHKEIIEGYPIHIATTNKDGAPNLAVVSATRVLDATRLLISNNDIYAE